MTPGVEKSSPLAGGPASPGPVAPASGELFCSREEAAAMLGLSIGGLSLAMSRGELEGLYMRVGRSIRFCRPAIAIRSAGLTGPADLGAFCGGAGIRDLEGLLRFFGGGL